ncbi:hypothetical protein SAMN05421854_10786 [Amycolatopsis rubida]|uniref:Uncharacterized protein n=1 Tax=Amycolatopsis rubida TaxID=112413 RepID=A0A1I5TFC1_9PSEU|nr:hypothetical protein SAMN05421854_10786 [Amycolatopsis rubida]
MDIKDRLEAAGTQIGHDRLRLGHLVEIALPGERRLLQDLNGPQAVLPEEDPELRPSRVS